ncbi:MAG: hypothetical protein ACC660_06115, partial [Acidimicrobiales bacterium]
MSDMELGTLAYGSVAGASAATALLFLIIGGHRDAKKFLALPIAFLASASALTATTTIWMHTRDNVADYEAILRGPFAIASLVSVVALVALVAAWTDFSPRWALVGLAVGTLLVGILVIVLPESLLTGEITGLRDVSFLGQSLTVHEAQGSPWRPVLDLWLIATLAYIATALVHGFRRGNRTDAGMLALGLAVLIGVGAYDSLVDLGLVSTPYLAPFGFMFVVAASAVHPAIRIDEL